MPLKVLNILYNCHDNCLHLICVWEYMNYTFYPNCIIMIIMKYKYGAIYLGRPENREGGGLEIPDKPGQGEGGWFAKNRTSGKSKSPKNKYRNYSIMSNFTTVFTCISRPFSQISRCLEILRDFSEIISDNISENISERSPGISDSFPGIWRFVETVEIL